MNDTGLLCAACMENIQFNILKGNLEVNLGSILENVIAQSLKSNGFNLNYFDSLKYGEIDFVVQNGMKTELIEVKSGKDYKAHKALNNILAVEDWSFEKSYVLCGNNISAEDKIIYLPWYMVMFIRKNEIPENMIYEVDISGL